MQSYRSRARVGARLSALPIFLLLALAAVVVAALYVAGRMLMAPRPAIALAAPFDLVGRNATLSLDARDATGLRTLKVTIRQGDKEQTVVDETYQPPRTEVHFEWRPGKQARLPLREGPGLLRSRRATASWGHFFQGKTATLEKEFTARLTPPARRGPHHPALRESGRVRHGGLPGHAAGSGERRAGG
jgi:hypothetical protein